MATKDYCIRLKEKHNLTATTDQFFNINLNKLNCNHSLAGKQYHNNGKGFVTDKARWNGNNNNDDGGGYDRVRKAFKLKPVIQKTNLIYSHVLPPLKTPTTATIAKSSSTLSLHIAAYENSIDAVRERPIIDNNAAPASMNNGLSTCPFEFPRQQKESNNSEPEIAQFKASQKLLKPNPDAAGPGSTSFSPDSGSNSSASGTCLTSTSSTSGSTSSTSGSTSTTSGSTSTASGSTTSAFGTGLPPSGTSLTELANLPALKSNTQLQLPSDNNPTQTSQNVGTAKQNAAKPTATTATSTSSSTEDEEENAKEKEEVQAEVEEHQAIREKITDFKFNPDHFTRVGNYYIPVSVENSPAGTKKAVEEIMKQFEGMIKKKSYIASGKFGSVSLVDVRGLNPNFVQKTFKKLEDETLEALEAELGVYDKMTSEFFPKLLMAGIGADNQYHMVMENINCGTLYDHREGIQPADIPFMVLQVATAIKQLHAFQLTHGDIKTDNIGIRESGHIVMLDFGCSRFVGYATQLPITPLCAPEVEDREDAGLPSDWYSVGMMMLQLYHKSKAARQIPTGDRVADEFIKELTKEKPAERPLNVFDHQYLKRRNLKPSFFPSQLPSKKQQAPQHEEIDKLDPKTIDDIYKQSLIRFPSKKHFFSFK